MGSDTISMRCPACRGLTFVIEFLDDSLLGRGPVEITCSGCSSRWSGKLSLEKGRVEGPCCTDGYEETENG